MSNSKSPFVESLESIRDQMNAYIAILENPLSTNRQIGTAETELVERIIPLVDHAAVTLKMMEHSSFAAYAEKTLAEVREDNNRPCDCADCRASRAEKFATEFPR